MRRTRPPRRPHWLNLAVVVVLLIVWSLIVTAVRDGLAPA
jgi:hypothetical protein